MAYNIGVANFVPGLYKMRFPFGVIGPSLLLTILESV